MLGRIYPAGSFRQTLDYCLEDKRLSQAQGGGVLFKDRAEIIWYNQCFGNKQELTRQFNEVARLEPNMSLPVFHITLSLPPGEQLKKGALAELAADCARSLDFEKNQYVAILHKDTARQHLHLVANRVGFDRHTVSDSFSHGKIADFCRQAERRHGLRQELSPRRYLTEEQRQIPRHGLRLDKLKQHIREALQESRDYPQFEHSMRQRGYTVFKSEKGIAFMDEKQVVFKGSEAGHSLHSIEANLAMGLSRLQQEVQRRQLSQQQEEQQRERERHHHHWDEELSL
ncbi:MAG TPA: relaxase/mobilization nuclease domain-containing protein [Puia sp.]|nr:relaxase/mobilization nuclease domain-containing protein [Puia sp.]